MSAMLAALLALTGILNNPPEDLLSLVNTEIILKTLKADQSETALIDLIGGVKSSKKLDTARFEAAFKMLREGNAKERREAKKVLNAAGRDALPFIKKYVNDKDPEVSQTARNIIKNSDAAAKQAASSGTSPEILKLLAIRRLTELKSAKALPAVKELTKSPDFDVAKEARRAEAILEGKKPVRAKRGEASLKALQLVPENSGFAFILDMTEPTKPMSLLEYIKQAGKMPMPGMNPEMLAGQFNQFLPQVLAMVGNPQIDSIAVAMADDIGISNNAWAGFIFKGSYNLKKVKNLLGMQMEPREFKGKKYYAQKWGPSIFPVDENTLIISVGEGNHMNPFIEKLSAKKIPEKFAALKNTSTARFQGMGTLSKEQREMMRDELKTELKRIEGRNRPEIAVQKALINVALLFADMTAVKAVIDKEIVISGSFTEESKADKMAKAVTVADEEIRKIFETQGGGMMAQFLDTKKPFSVSSSEGKNFTVKFKSDFLKIGLLSMLMADAELRAAPDPAEDVPEPAIRIREK